MGVVIPATNTKMETDNRSAAGTARNPTQRLAAGGDA